MFGYLREKRRFVIVYLILLGFIYFVALKSDQFALALSMVIPLISFFVIAVKGLVKAIRKKNVKVNLITSALSVIFILAMLGALIISDHGLHELNKERKAAFNEIRPVFMEYKDRNGCFPERLKDLVPKYIDEIPSVLLYNEETGHYMQIRYELEKNKNPFFHYHRMRGPDSGVHYYIAEDRYWYDQ